MISGGDRARLAFPLTPFRQRKQLAEGQKGAEVKRFLIAPPALRPPMELAEWVKSLEKNACFVVFGGPFGEGGYLCKKWPSGQGRVPLG